MIAGGRASINTTARLAGGLYLALVPLGFFSFVYVPSVLLVQGDAATSSRNIMASEWLFRGGTLSHLISQILVVFLVLALYRLLEPVNKDHAVLMVVLALLGIPMAFLNEVNHLAALRVPAGRPNTCSRQRGRRTHEDRTTAARRCFFASTQYRETDDFSALFTSEAVVSDEAHEYRGSAIKAWIDRATAEYKPHAEVAHLATVGDKTVVTAQVSGTFPGSPIQLRYNFTLMGDKIAALTIGS